MFSKYCQSCGGVQNYTTKGELSRAIKNNTICRSCRNKQGNGNKGNYRDIPISWFDEKRRKAISRNKEFDITIEYLWSIYLKQNKVCALSGVPLDFNRESNIGMVSIDRINNDKGYVKRNIQLVDKRVNFMKYIYTQKEFIEMCKRVAKHQE
jgi:hypothetical protein